MKMHVSSILVTFSLLLSVNIWAQKIEKENLSKQVTNFWDFNKIKVQSTGKYYVDQLGETTDEHGKWLYYDREGGIQEERNYYKGMLFGKVTRFYANGQKEQEGYFKWDRQDSLYFEWYETGKLKTEGYYQLGKPIGTWKYYYRDGRLKSVEEVRDTVNYVWEFYQPDSLHTQTIKDGNGELITYFTTGAVNEWYNYENGIKHGPFEEYSIYGHTLINGSFVNGQKDGEWNYFYYTGQKEKSSHYKKGILDGPYVYYYDNGTINVQGEYADGVKSGLWTWYTKKGTKDMEGTFKEGQQHGDWVYWYPTGEKSYDAKYDMGKRSGKWVYLYKNGKQFKQGTFADDEKNGRWETWYEDETLLMEGDYENGKENGIWKNYWENGELKNIATFETGRLNGMWESYYPNGKLHLKGKYKDDLKTGEWLSYFENGKPKDVMTYKLFKKKSSVDYGPMKDHVVMESKLNGHSISYSSKDFKLTEEGNYKEGVKDGEWIAYHPGGRNPAVISNYKNGELNGKMKQFDRRGKIMSEIDYKDGLKHGSFILFDKRGKVLSEKKFEYGMQVIEGKTNTPGSFTPGR